MDIYGHVWFMDIFMDMYGHLWTFKGVARGPPSAGLCTAASPRAQAGGRAVGRFLKGRLLTTLLFKIENWKLWGVTTSRDAREASKELESIEPCGVLYA